MKNQISINYIVNNVVLGKSNSEIATEKSTWANYIPRGNSCRKRQDYPNIAGQNWLHQGNL